MTRLGLLSLVVWLAGAASARADVLVFNPPDTKASPPTRLPLNAQALTDQLPPGTPNPVRESKTGKTYFALGRIEGFDEPYTWAPGVMPGKPSTLVFRPRLPDGALAQQTMIVPVGMLQRVHHEVDHPFDLALLFGDRGVPDSTVWKASVRLGLGRLADVLPSLKALGTGGASVPSEAELGLHGGALWTLTQPEPAPGETDAQFEERAKGMRAAFSQDLSLTVGGSPDGVARLLLRGLAELEHFPERCATDLLPRTPDGEEGYRAFRKAIKTCLSFLCRLVSVEPKTVGGRRLHGAGASARAAVIGAIEGARSGRLDVFHDLERFLEFRAQAAQVTVDDGAFTADDVARYRALFANPPPTPTHPPEGIPLSPSHEAITALQYLIREPSWWLVYPEADDSYTLIVALVQLAPLTNARGEPLPDPRNADGVVPPLADFRQQPAGSPRRVLCGKNGVGVRALSLLLHDPRVAARDDPDFEAWAGERQSEIRGADAKLKLEERIVRAAEVFGNHVLRLAAGGQYGQRRWINRALLFAGQSGSLSAEAEAVRNLFAVATHSDAPRPAAEPDAFGTLSDEASAFDWGSGDDGAGAVPTPDSKRQAIETLLTLANLGSDDHPASLAQQVIQELHALDVRRALEVATPGEVTMLQVVGLLEAQGKDGHKGEAQRMARGTGRRLSAHVQGEREALGRRLREARERLERARSSGTPEEEAEAAAELADLESTRQAYGRLKH